MPSLPFMKCWTQPVLSGSKRQTIRPVRKRVYKPGQMLHFFTGMRTKHCVRLGRAECLGVARVMRGGAFNWFFLGEEGKANPAFFNLIRSATVLSRPHLVTLAKQDGFKDVETFEEWFMEHSPGQKFYVLTWGKITKGDAK